MAWLGILYDMDLLAETAGKQYSAVCVDGLSGFVAPAFVRPFPCLIWDHRGGSTADDRHRMAEALLDADCRYMVCAGVDAERWECSLDDACVMRHLDDADEVLEAMHVMTTSHADETVDDVAFFFVRCTDFDDHEFMDYLVVHVGQGGLKEEVNAAVREWALGLRSA